jgi:hypothetical protein
MPCVEEMDWSVRVSAAGGTGGADVLARSERWRIAAPVSFDAEARGLSALECFLGALGGDLVSGFLRLAEQRRLTVDHAEAVVRAGLDRPLSYLGAVGEDGAPAVGRIGIEVFVSSPASEGDVRAAWEEALARSPLALRASPGLDVRLTVTV